MMGAGLECDISGRPFGSRAGARQRLAFGMRPSAGLCPTAADHPAVAHQDAADRGIGPYRSQSALSQGQCGGHVVLVHMGVMNLCFRHPGRR